MKKKALRAAAGDKTDAYKILYELKHICFIWEQDAKICPECWLVAMGANICSKCSAPLMTPLMFVKYQIDELVVKRRTRVQI